MLIGEIAAIAQVSPRAIRHYHRVGVLPEPARSSNGYRAYDVMDLTRLLRLRRLISLGLPLHRIKETLRDEPEFLETELEVLESDVLTQIDLLHQQLTAIRSARASASPDSFELYDGADRALRGLWSLPGVQQIERDVGLLLASTGDEALLGRLRAGFDDPVRLDELSQLGRRFQSIDENFSLAERGALVEEMGRVLAPWADVDIQPQLSELVNSYLKQAFTPAQLDVLSEVTQKLDAGKRAPPA